MARCKQKQNLNFFFQCPFLCPAQGICKALKYNKKFLIHRPDAQRAELFSHEATSDTVTHKRKIYKLKLRSK
jgi:hypothetical protein